MSKRIKDIMKGIVFICFIVIAIGFAGYTETHYTREGIITEVEGEWYIVTTIDGNEWAFSGSDYEIGNWVKINFHTNYTDDTIYDDIIGKVSLIKNKI